MSVSPELRGEVLDQQLDRVADQLTGSLPTASNQARFATPSTGKPTVTRVRG